MRRVWSDEHGWILARAIIGAFIAGLLWLAYGAFAGLATGAGHGTYLPIYLLITPFNVGPAVWCMIGALVANVRRSRFRRILIPVLLAYYAVGLTWLLIKDHEYYDYFPGGPGDFFAAVGIVLLAIPHLAIWLAIADAIAGAHSPS